MNQSEVEKSSSSSIRLRRGAETPLLSTELQLLAMRNENLRLQRLVGELLIKNQQLRQQTPAILGDTEPS